MEVLNAVGEHWSVNLFEEPPGDVHDPFRIDAHQIAVIVAALLQPSNVIERRGAQPEITLVRHRSEVSTSGCDAVNFLRRHSALAYAHPTTDR